MRLWCWLFGHRPPVVWWEQWRDNPEIGRHRNLLSICPRCESVFDIRSEVEDEPWTP